MNNTKNDITPPKLAERFLLWFLKADLAEDVLGDLDEKFYSTAKKHSVRKARRNYWYQVINYLRPFAFRFFKFKNSTTTAMFKHHLLSSYRHLARNKIYALINILGLTLGVLTLLLASTFYLHEHSYDQFYSGSDSEPIQRVISYHRDRASDYLAYYIGDQLLENIPELTNMTRFKVSTLKSVISLQSSPENAFDESRVAFADINHFDFFELKFIQGSSNRFALVNNSVVLTESTAKKYFGNSNAIGQLIRLEMEGITMEVVGVIEDYPANSSIQFAMIGSIENLKNHPQLPNYFEPEYSSFHTFIKAKQTTLSLLKTKVDDFANTNLEIAGSPLELQLELLSDVHLNSEVLPGFYTEKGDTQFVNWLVGIALVILLMGMINYSNLSLALAFKQTKAVGIRKAIGVRSQTVFQQFMTDTLLICFIVLIISIFLFEFTLPPFERFVNRNFSELGNSRLQLYLLATGTCFFAGILAGFYRAIVLSRIKPTALLKGEKAIPRLSRFKSFLLWLQFSLAFILISTTFYMNSQLRYVLNKDLGADIENRLVLKNVNGHVTLKTELLKIEGIEKVAASTFYPGMKNPGGSKKLIDFIPGLDGETMTLMGVDESFFDLYNINIIDNGGMKEDQLFSDHSDFVLLNETTQKLFGPKHPKGTLIKPLFRGQNSLIVQGTVSDVYIASLHQKITPMAFIPISKTYASKYINIAYASSVEPYELLPKIESIYREILPTKPFEPIILEDHISKLYEEETRMKALLNTLTLINLFIILSGVLGMVLSNTESRLKEISIRKVLGAGSWQLLKLQNSKLLQLILLSLIAGIPLAIVAIDYWKTDFIYRIDISPQLFAGVTFIIVTSSLLVSGLLTFKAFRVNPSKILRQE